MKETIGIIVIAAFLTGCTAGIDEDAARKANAGLIIDCTDTRDGEKFVFRGEDVHNVRVAVGYGDTCFSVTSLDGVKREMCSSYAAWLKCTPRKR